METIKIYKAIHGSGTVESLRFVNGNFEQVEKFIGADIDYHNGRVLLPTSRGVLKASEGDHIIKFKNGNIQVMNYIDLRSCYEMVRK